VIFSASVATRQINRFRFQHNYVLEGGIKPLNKYLRD
jgi:hypothetical protein